MLIKKITLYNFRQYFDHQSMVFSAEEGKNVNVIHGENGSGKTALLNAFSWVLYGETDLPDSDKLINSYALESSPDARRAEMFVELEFESKGIQYILRRTFTGIKYDDQISDVDVNVLLKYYTQGKWNKLSNPSTEINRILPQNLRSYFFFDGEQIDHLSRHEDNNKIREAVKSVMDLEIIERGIKHTEDAKKEFEREWANFADEETKALLNEREELSSKKDDLHEELGQYNLNVENRERQIKDIDEKLSLVKGISEKQEERKQLEEALTRLKQKLNSTQSYIRKSLSKEGHLIPINIIKDKIMTKLDVEEDRETNNILDITPNLIRSIMDQGKCICGEELTDDHKEHLETLLSQVAPTNKRASLNSLKKEIDLVSNSRGHFLNKLKTYEVEEYQLKEEIIDTENMLEEISADLSNRDYEDVHKLEENRRLYQEQITEYYKKIGRIENDLEEVEGLLNKVSKQIEKQQQIQEKAQLAKRRYETSMKLIKVMENIYSLKEREVRTGLQEKIQSVYSNFLRKGFKVSLTDDFKLVVTNYLGERVPLSQGERQITSLSFIGAIVDTARENYREREGETISEGGIYPLVMDSPFGALDSDHRMRVAQGIPNLSDQLIVIVSTSQWQGEVENELKKYIGSEYRLNYHDPRQDAETSFEYTEIQRGV